MLSRRRSLLRLKVARDQSCALVEGEIRPRPLEKDDQPVAEANQKDYVHKQPCQPGGKTAEMHELQICDSFVPANCRHCSLVPITEALRFTPSYHRKYVARGVASLLHCYR